MQNVVANKSGAFSAAISHSDTGRRMSVSIGKWGPCCSIAPAGINTTLSCRTASFTSGHVILPRCVIEIHSPGRVFPIPFYAYEDGPVRLANVCLAAKAENGSFG